MSKIKFGLIGILIFAGGLSIAAYPGSNVRFSYDVDKTSGVKKSFSDSIDRMKRIVDKRPYQLRHINDSIRETIEAAQLWVSGRDPEKALALARSAIKKYSDNIMAYLIAGELYEESGNIEEASEARLNFLKVSNRAPRLAVDIMTWQDRTNFYNYVAGRLEARGIRPPKPEGINSLPLIQRIAWEERNNLREIINVGLPFIVCAGLVFYFIRIVTGADLFLERPNRILLQFYFLLLGLYCLWIAHLFINLPVFIYPVEMEITLLFLAGTSVIAGSHLIQVILQRRKELADPEVMPCPHCGKAVSRIVQECPFCRGKIDVKD